MINDDALAEDTDPDFEMQCVDISNVDSAGNIAAAVPGQIDVDVAP